jgi:geranylgeranyl diphosphate synthase, type I
MTSSIDNPREAPSAVDMRDRMLARVEERIEALLSDERRRWSSVNQRGAVPVDTIAALVGAGGKRLRPAFCLTGYLAAGGDPSGDVVVDTAAALEFLHAFALLHDDVLDDSSMRRGAPTAHVVHAEEHRAKEWRGESRRFGEGVANLAGDLAHIYADRLAGVLPANAREIWSELKTEVIIGQYFDVAVAAEFLPDPALSRWIADCKSGRYTIHRPLLLGATIAGRDDLAGTFGRYGHTLGEAFQLRDDLIDAFGDSDVSGKPAGLDFEGNKMTLLLALAMERDERIGDLLSKDPALLRQRLEEMGVRAEVETRIDHLVDAARQAVAQAPVEPVWRAELAEMAIRIAYRVR